MRKRGLSGLIGKVRGKLGGVAEGIETAQERLDLTRFPWFRTLATASAAAMAMPGVLAGMPDLEQHLGELRAALGSKTTELRAALDEGLASLAELAADPAKLLADAEDLLLEVAARQLARSGPALLQLTLHAAGVDVYADTDFVAAIERVDGGQEILDLLRSAVRALGLDAIGSALSQLHALVSSWKGNLEALNGVVTTFVDDHLSNIESFESMFVSRSATGEGALEVDAASEQAMSASQGQPLEPAVQAEMEAQFGTDFSQVRIHTDSHAAVASDRLQANAMARGKDVYFASGQYDPQSGEGKRLLAHELAHTVQDGAAPKKDAAAATHGTQGVRRKARTSAPGDATEHQADAAADQAVAGRGVTALGGVSGAATVHRDTAMKQQFGQRLVELGKTIGGWEALLEQLDGNRHLDFEQFVKELTGQRHGAALIDPLMDDPQVLARTVRTPLETFEVGGAAARAGAEISAAAKRWKIELEKLEVGSGEGAAEVERKTLTMAESEWAALQHAYAASSLLLWAQRHHKGTTSLAETLASPKVKPKLEAQLAALQKRCESGDIGSFTPWQVRRESGQVVIGTDAEALTGQLAVKKKLGEWFEDEQQGWAKTQWGKSLVEDHREWLDYDWSEASVVTERSQRAAAQFIDVVSSQVQDSDKVDPKAGIKRLLKRASLTEKARLQVLGLIANDVREAIGVKAPPGPADGGVSLREAVLQQVRIEKIGGGHLAVVLNVPKQLFKKVDGLLEDRLPLVQKYFVDDRIAAFESAQAGVLSAGSFKDWSATEVAEEVGLREQVARSAVTEESAKPDKDLVSLVKTSGNPLRHATLNPLGEHIVAALRAALASFVEKTDGVLAEHTRFEVDSRASEVGELFIAGLGGAEVSAALVKAVDGASHVLAGNAATKQVKGVVAFMLELGLNKSCNGVTLADFRDSTKPVAWDHKLKGKSHNKEWLKDRFRAADSGSHEWIPSNLMLEMIERADSAAGAIKGAKWILAQHWLRSPTTQIIFEPSKYSDEWKAFQDADEEHLAAMAETLDTASKLGLSGHVGALYLLDAGSSPMQVKTYETEWHNKLRQVVQQVRSSPEELVEALEEHVIGDPDPDATVEREVWSGSLKTLPEGLQKMAPHIESDYYNGAKLDGNRKQLATTLQALADRQRKNFDAIADVFRTVALRLEEYDG